MTESDIAKFLPYYPEMPDMANCCKHYPKEKISRDPPEIYDVVESNCVFCNVFDHEWKREEIKWKIDADKETDSFDCFRLIGIISQCKKCDGFCWEYFPHDRFKNDLTDEIGEFEEIE